MRFSVPDFFCSKKNILKPFNFLRVRDHAYNFEFVISNVDTFSILVRRNTWACKAGSKNHRSQQKKERVGLIFFHIHIHNV